MIINIFDRTGSWLGDYRAATDRSWMLNEAGKCVYTLPLINDRGEKLRQELVEYGRYIYIESNDPPLPAWAGVITLPRPWAGFALTVNARSAEYLFNFRVLPAVETYEGSPGAIFAKWIEEANSDEDQLLREGDIYGGGTSREEESQMELIYSRVLRLAEESGEEFSVEPAFDAFGKLYFKANWHKKIGVTEIQPLRESQDLVFTTPVLEEQGNPELANKIIGYGDGANMSTRPRHVEIDEVSKARYGLIEYPKYYPGKKGSGLAESVKTDLKEMANPRRVIKIEIGERRTDAIGRVRIGNYMTMEMLHAIFSGDGFGASILTRVKSMSHNEKKALVTVKADEEIS